MRTSCRQCPHTGSTLLQLCESSKSWCLWQRISVALFWKMICNKWRCGLVESQSGQCYRPLRSVVYGMERSNDKLKHLIAHAFRDVCLCSGVLIPSSFSIAARRAGYRSHKEADDLLITGRQNLSCRYSTASISYFSEALPRNLSI